MKASTLARYRVLWVTNRSVRRFVTQRWIRDDSKGSRSFFDLFSSCRPVVVALKGSAKLNRAGNDFVFSRDLTRCAIRARPDLMRKFFEASDRSRWTPFPEVAN